MSVHVWGGYGCAYDLVSSVLFWKNWVFPWRPLVLKPHLLDAGWWGGIRAQLAWI